MRGLCFKPCGGDTLFARQNGRGVVINDLDPSDPRIKTLLFNQIDSDTEIMAFPSCGCGHLTGRYREGQLCPDCDTYCETKQVNSLDVGLWFRRPAGVGKLISPYFLKILMSRYKFASPTMSAIEWFIDTSFKPNVSAKNISNYNKLLVLANELKWKRSYTYFVDNWYEILMAIENSIFGSKTAGKGRKTEEFFEFMLANEADIFVDMLPFPNKLIFPVEKTAGQQYVDDAAQGCLNACISLTGLDTRNLSPERKEKVVAKALIGLSDFYVKYLDSNVLTHYALYRQCISGHRGSFNARNIIVGLPFPHRYDEVKVCWQTIVTLMVPHLYAKLFHRLKGTHTPKQIRDLIDRSKRTYEPLIQEGLLSLLEDTQGEGFGMLLLRNPTLHPGNMVLLRCFDWGTNPDEVVTHIPDSIIPPTNADFDGDAMTIYLVYDRMLREKLQRFTPDNNLFHPTKYGQFAGNLGLSKTHVSTLHNYFGKED